MPTGASCRPVAELGRVRDVRLAAGPASPARDEQPVVQAVVREKLAHQLARLRAPAGGEHEILAGAFSSMSTASSMYSSALPSLGKNRASRTSWEWHDPDGSTRQATTLGRRIPGPQRRFVIEEVDQRREQAVFPSVVVDEIRPHSW